MFPRRVLVTGANGFVGRILCRSLIATGFEVRGAVRSSEAADDLPGSHMKVGDIGPDTDWSYALQGVDAVVHLAARTHMLNDAANDPLAAYRATNVAGSARLVQQAVRAGVSHVVFMSSVKVNGELTQDNPFTERDPPRPQDAYGISKLEAERRLYALCADSQTALTVLRPPLLYGYGVKGNLFALMRAIARGLPLPLGAVHNRRTLLDVENLVAAIILCMRHPDARGATFLVGDDPPVSTIDLACEIARAMQRRARLIPVPIAVLRMSGALFGRQGAVQRLTSSLVVDSSAIRRLGWQPRRSFNQGVADMVRGYLADAG